MQGALIVLNIQGNNFTYRIEFNLSRIHFNQGEIKFKI